MNATLTLTLIVSVVGVLTGFLVGCYVARNRVQLRRGARPLGVGLFGWLVFTVCIATGVKLTSLLAVETGWIMAWGTAFATVIMGFVWAFIVLKRAGP